MTPSLSRLCRAPGKRAIDINMHSAREYTWFASAIPVRTAAYDETRDRFQS